MQLQTPHIIRMAVRGLRRARGTSAIAMITLAIGLATSVVIMGMFNAGARALPVPDGRQVVGLALRDARARLVDAPVPLDAWAIGGGVLEAGALQQLQGTLVHDGHAALRTSGAAMHASVFQLLRVQPALGRWPTDEPADETSLVIGWDLWQELGADPALLGAAVRVDDVVHTLIGVMPEGFGFPENHAFWTVLPRTQGGEVVLRLATGTSKAEAAAALQTRVSTFLATAEAELPYNAQIQSWTTKRDSGGEGALFAGLAVLAILLLVVCATNVSTLLLVRGNERATLLAVHAALGATRAQVAGQLFAEAVLIALGGGLLGLAAGSALLRWMEISLSQHWGYYWMSMEVRPPVLLGTFAAVLITAVLAGTVPAIKAMRIDIARMLVGSGRGQHGRSRSFGRWSVGVQVALSTVGLVVAAYLAWGAGQLDKLTERLPMDEMAVAAITLPGGRYQDPAVQAALVADLERELRRTPGARTVSIGNALPGASGGVSTFRKQGDAAAAEPIRMSWIGVDENVTDAYSMRVVAGRTFTAADNAGSAPVVILTTETAQRHFDNDAIGRLVRLESLHGADRWAEVVGVVDDWQPERAGRPSDRALVPLGQVDAERLTIAIRAADPAQSVAHMRAAVARVDAQLPVEELQTLRARMDWFLRMSRVIAGFGVFGGIASALVAAVGLFGVIAFQVRSRHREIGTRMAVGASSRRIVLQFVRESVLRVLPGLVVGALFSAAVAPMVAAFAGGTGSPDVLLFAVVISGMLAVGIVAALHPAWRASRLDPQVVLRSE